MKYFVSSLLIFALGYLLGNSSKEQLHSSSQNEGKHIEVAENNPLDRDFQSQNEGLRKRLSLFYKKEFSPLRKNSELSPSQAYGILAQLLLFLEKNLSLTLNDHETFFVQNFPDTLAALSQPSNLPTHDPINPAPAYAELPYDTEWVQPEKELIEVQTQRDIEDFLKKTELKNLLPALYRSTPVIKEKMAQQINGKFEGEIQFISQESQKQKNWQIYLDTQSAKIKNQRLTGETRVELREGKEVISGSRDKGTIEVFRELDAKSSAVLLELSEDHFVQLYYLSRQDAFAGNFYQTTQRDKIEKVGTVLLERIAP